MYMNCPRSCKACNVQGEALKELQAHRVRLSKVGGDERLLETKYGYKQSLAADLQEETKTAIQEM
jgi:phage shock protein A